MNGCAGCTQSWGGLKRAHCAACHETFSTPNNFDRHRRNFTCLAPEDVGLVHDGEGIWQLPARPAVPADSLEAS
jgi:hypothetical protein